MEYINDFFVYTTFGGFCIEWKQMGSFFLPKVVVPRPLPPPGPLKTTIFYIAPLGVLPPGLFPWPGQLANSFLSLSSHFNIEKVFSISRSRVWRGWYLVESSDEPDHDLLTHELEVNSIQLIQIYLIRHKYETVWSFEAH